MSLPEIPWNPVGMLCAQDLRTVIKSFSRLPWRCAVLPLSMALGWPAALSAQVQHGGVPALYATQAEAEKAAELHFNCSGAHRMGDQWMPCSQHGKPPASVHAH